MTEDYLQAALNGEELVYNAKKFEFIQTIVEHNEKLLSNLNYSYHDHSEKLELISSITQQQVSSTNDINTPFHTDFGPHIFLGKNTFINRDCLFVDLGGITIDDEVLIGPRVSLITVNHDEQPSKRRNLICSPIHIKQNAWIGANATVLPGVTIGANAIIAANAVVTKNVPDNSVVAGVPAKVIRKLKED